MGARAKTKDCYSFFHFHVESGYRRVNESENSLTCTCPETLSFRNNFLFPSQINVTYYVNRSPVQLRIAQKSRKSKTMNDTTSTGDSSSFRICNNNIKYMCDKI